MKTVARVGWLHEADAIRMQLEAHGIRAFIPDEGMAGANPLLGQAMGGIRVQVDDRDADEALAVLAAVKQPVAAGERTCPACGSDDVQVERWSRRACFIGILLIGLPFVWMKRRCICGKCRHEWKLG